MERKDIAGGNNEKGYKRRRLLLVTIILAGIMMAATEIVPELLFMENCQPNLWASVDPDEEPEPSPEPTPPSTPMPTPLSSPTPGTTPTPRSTPTPAPTPTPCYHLTVSVDPEEGGTVSVKPDQDCYPNNSRVTMSVNLSKGYKVLGWGYLNCASTDCDITMSVDTTATVYVSSPCENIKNRITELEKKKGIKEKDKQKLEKQIKSAENLIEVNQKGLEALLFWKGYLTVINCASSALNVVKAGAATTFKFFRIQILQIVCTTAGEYIGVNVVDLNDEIERLRKSIKSYEKQIEQYIYQIWEIGRIISNIKRDIASLRMNLGAIPCN